MTVSASNSEPASAKMMASATGMNSLPSSPCSVSSGTKTMMMISTPEATGSSTSHTERNTVWTSGAASRSCPC